jgi:hypothetical protein
MTYVYMYTHFLASVALVTRIYLLSFNDHSIFLHYMVIMSYPIGTYFSWITQYLQSSITNVVTYEKLNNIILNCRKFDALHAGFI